MFLKLQSVLFCFGVRGFPLDHMYEPALFIRNPLLSRCCFEIYFRNVLETFEMGLLALSPVQSVCLSSGYSHNDADNSGIIVISCSSGQIPEGPEFNSEIRTDPVGK